LSAAKDLELKTPITAMHLQLQLLERKYEERHVQAALDRSRKLRLLLDELFDLTRLRSGKLELHLASIALKPILLDIVQTLQTEAETKGSVLKRLFGTSLSF
jgi:signal transduction histidine kinase